MKFRFSTPTRSVTVHAKTEEDAWNKARKELDRRAEKQGHEVPVAWSLTLRSIDEVNVQTKASE